MYVTTLVIFFFTHSKIFFKPVLTLGHYLKKMLKYCLFLAVSN